MCGMHRVLGGAGCGACTLWSRLMWTRSSWQAPGWRPRIEPGRWCASWDGRPSGSALGASFPAAVQSPHPPHSDPCLEPCISRMWAQLIKCCVGMVPQDELPSPAPPPCDPNQCPRPLSQPYTSLVPPTGAAVLCMGDITASQGPGEVQA